ncbi:hypothetical protein HK101_004968, partial [Irineochytrium annulatum]
MTSKNFFALLADDGDEDRQTTTAPAAQKETAAPAKDEQKNNKRSSTRTDYPRRGGNRTSVPVTSHDAGVLKERNGPVNASLSENRGYGDRNDGPRRDRVDRGGYGGGDRGGYGGDRGERGDRNRNDRHGERGLGEHGGRGGRGGGGGYRGREFDRHSANARYDGEKKDVAGKGSWGNPVTAEGEAAKDSEAVEGDAPKENGEEAGKADAAAAPAPEPEENFKTLEQYIAEREASKPAPAVTARKANEGSDDAQWKDAVVVHKKEEDEYFSANKGAKAKKVKEVKTKVALDIEQRFNDEPQSFRGGRGGGRGGRGG